MKDISAAIGDAASDLSESTNALRVVIIFEDPVTRDWAYELWGRVASLIGKDGVRLNTWKISDLTHPRIFPLAIEEAATADVMLVSLRAAEELPIPFYVWVDAWLPRRHSTQGALVALIGFVEQTGGSSAHAEDYLRAVASRAQMDFLLRDRKLAAQAENMAYAEELSQRAKAMTPVLGQILSQRVDPYRHWGINE